MADGMRIDAINGIKNDKYLDKTNENYSAAPRKIFNSAFEEYRKKLAVSQPPADGQTVAMMLPALNGENINNAHNA